MHAEAHQLYLQGRYKVQKLDHAQISEAIDIFSTALQKAPDYPPALAGLGQCYILLGYLNAVMPEEAFRNQYHC